MEEGGFRERPSHYLLNHSPQHACNQCSFTDIQNSGPARLGQERFCLELGGASVLKMQFMQRICQSWWDSAGLWESAGGNA